MLDLDDVICLNAPYGGYDVTLKPRPADLFDLLFEASCVAALRAVDAVHKPKYVITSSWLRFFDRNAIASVFRRCGLNFIVDSLHDAWEAPQNAHETRASAIQRWLKDHHEGEPFVILDDTMSGTGLASSKALSNHLVLCEANKGLGPAHIAVIGQILTRLSGAQRRTAPARQTT
jgi:hypothetical protein